MAKSLLAVISEMKKEYGENTIGKKLNYRKYERIPFSSPSMNYCLYGGIPRGVLVQFWGDQGSGKTTTCLDLIKNAQRLFQQEYEADLKDATVKSKPTGKKEIVFIDVENTFDNLWATKLGVVVDDIILVRPEGMYAEEIFDTAMNLIETGQVGLIILDSLASMTAKAEQEKKHEERTIAGIASVLTRFTKRAAAACGVNNCTFIGINQVRERMGQYGSQFITTGGRAWKHGIVVDLFFKKGDFIDENNSKVKTSYQNPSGNMIEVTVTKTKICPPNRKSGSCTLNYSKGIDRVADLVRTAEDFGYVKKGGGGWYTLKDVDTGEVYELDEKGSTKIQGLFNFCNALIDEGYVKSLMETVNEKLSEIVIDTRFKDDEDEEE